MDTVLAYIEPGAGSLDIQAQVAGLMVVPIIFRRQVSRIVQTLRGDGDEGQAATAPNDAKGG